MTETECYDCDYAENCDFDLIIANNSCISPPCEARAWHIKSMKTFYDMTQVIRKKIEGGGEEVVRAEWGDYKHDVPAFKKVSPVTVGEFCERSKLDKDLM